MTWWMFTPQFPAVAIGVWILLALALMYLARPAAQRALDRFARLLHGQLRLAARSLIRAGDLMGRHNQQALRDLQQELVRRQLEREFQRLAEVVERDLAGFQDLQRRLNEQATNLSEDYEHSTQVPPAAPEWVAAVDAIARLPGDTSAEALGKILNDIHNTIQSQQREAMREYRWSINARHKILAGMRPYWRKLVGLLDQVGVKIDGLQRRIRHIDRLMERYESLLSGGRVTLAAIGTRFVLSSCVLALAAATALFNFELLSRPLAAALGGATLGPVLLADYAAGIHTLAVFGLGIVLFESLQISRMFPLICGMSARARSVMVLLTGSLLATLAVVESLLAAWWQSEGMSGLPAALPFQVLALLGALVPPLLATSVLSLESFSYTLRPVVASLTGTLLAVSAVLLRLLAAMALQVGQLLIQLYDIVLVLPLALERSWQQRSQTAKPADVATAGQQPMPLEPLRPVIVERRGGDGATSASLSDRG